MEDLTLINQYKFSKPKLFYHNYVKYCSEFYNTKGLNTYQIINLFESIP